MSNGGYKGNTPARETSPEQYPGVWELTEQFQAQADGNWPFQDTDCAPRSLRFDSSSSAYLSRTPLAVGNKRVFTFSCWVKRTKIGGVYPRMFGTYHGGSYIGWDIEFNNNDQIDVHYYSSGYVVRRTTEARYRDPSAWYSIVVSVDLNISGNDQVKLFVNGEQVTSFATTTNANIDTNIGDVENRIGYNYSHSDFVLADIHFIDGQALSCEEFGFFDGQGIWQPKRFTGDYASGPVYSNSVSTSGALENGNWAQVFDGTKYMYSGSGASNGPAISNGSLTFSPVGLSGRVVNAGVRGGSNKTYTVNGSAMTFGSSSSEVATIDLGSVQPITSIVGTSTSSSIWAQFYYIEVDGVVLTDATVGRNSFHLDFKDNSSNAALGTDTSGNSNTWTVNNLTAASNPNYTSNLVFTGGNYGGGHSADKAFDGDINTSALTANQGTAEYVTFTPGVAIPYSTSVEFTATTTDQRVSLNGGTEIVCTAGAWTTLASGSGTITEIKARANSSSWGRIAAIRVDGTILIAGDPPSIDSLVDSPVNGNQTDAAGLGGIVQGNYAVLNPLNSISSTTLSDGNLAMSSSSNWGSCMSTVAFTGGKFYYETTVTASNYSYIGASLASHLPTNYPSNDGSWALLNDGNCYYDQIGSNPITVNTGTSVPAGAVVGTAIDADNGKIWWSVNGVWIGSGSPNPATGSDPIFTNIPTDQALVACLDVYSNSATVNFGQRAFAYPLSGYKSLCTSNLPEPSIPIPSQYFDTQLWTGDGNSTRSISNYSFSPDFVWIKNRTTTGWQHVLYDQIRGAGTSSVTKSLSTDSTRAEASGNDTNHGYLSGFTSDGFDLTKGSQSGGDYVNHNNWAYVGWAWDAGDATTTIAAGSLNSSVYDQSQTWSSSLSTNASFGLAASRAFDGNLSTLAATTNSTTSNILFTKTFYNVTSLRVYMDHGTNWRVRVNGGTWANDSTFTSTNASWRDITSLVPANGTVTSIESYVPSGINNGTNWSAVEVNGKLLVDSGVTPPNVPSSASTVRANPSAGFSIVSYGNTSDGSTIGHILSASPHLIISKNRDSSSDWNIYFDGFGASDVINLNNNGAKSTSGSNTFIKAVSSTTFTVGSSSIVSGSEDYIAYCFAPVAGYSAIGSYQNPSSSEGAFVFLGFKPALLIIKCAVNISSSSGAGDWIIKDSTRSPFNNPSDGNTLVANVANAEDGYYSPGQAAIDFLSNGFKIRHPNSSPGGDPGRLYIYAAWAESPFKTARAQ